MCYIKARGNDYLRCPYRYKKELVFWAVLHRKFTTAQANKLTKKQLYAIWYNTNPSMLKTTGPLVHRKRR